MSKENNGPYTPEGEYNMTGPDGLRLIFQGSFERDEVMRQMNAAYAAGQASLPMTMETITERATREAEDKITYDPPAPSFSNVMTDAHLLAMAKEAEKVGYIAGVIAEATRSKWVPVSEASQPERNSTAIYYSRGGYIAIADEWRWEDHGERASHYLPFTPPQP